MALVMGAVILCLLGIGVLYFMMQRGPVELPQLRSFVEDRLNEQLQSEKLAVGGISVYSDEHGTTNRIQMNNVSLRAADGRLLLEVPEIRTNFSLISLLKGSLVPSQVEVVGSKIKLVRQRDGKLNWLRQSKGKETVFKGDVLALIDGFLKRDTLKNLATVTLKDTVVSIRDVRSGRQWEINNGLLTLTRDENQLNLRSEVDMALEQGGSTGIIANASHQVGTAKSDISLQLTNAKPRDLADMVGALDWLRYLDTQVSGSLSASLTGTGEVQALSSVLDLGQGRVRETPASLPIVFTRAKAYFEYDKVTDTLDFTQLQVDTSSGALTSDGYARLHRDQQGAVDSMSGQFRFSNIAINRPELFAQTLELDAAALDVRVSFAPLTIEVGALTAFDQDATYRIKGTSVAGQDFWQNSYDVDVDKISRDRVMAFWPVNVIPKTRKWLIKNFHQGNLSNFRGGLRSRDGKFNYAFNFDINDARVRFMRSMPELRDADGYGYLTNADLRVDLIRGHVISPDNTRVDVPGSSFFVPDITARSAIGEIELHLESGLQAALHLLDVEKFQFLKKVGLSPKVAQGTVVADGTLQVPLEKTANPSDVKFSVSADVLDLRSDTLVKGRILRAGKLKLNATDAGLKLFGPATLDQVPLDATWTMKFGPESKKGSRIVGNIGLSDKNLRGLGINLPKGSLSGEAEAQIVVDIKKGVAPEYVVNSDLVGAVLRVPALQWVKTTNTAGELKMVGQFGAVPTVDSLSLVAPGLQAQGKIDFNDDGTMRALILNDLKAGRWLDTAATILLTNSGAATISLHGGALDLRNISLAGGSSGASSSGNPIDVRLDKLTIITGLALTGFTAKLQPKNGLWGSFSGQVNGGTSITGQMFPQKHGTAFEINATDAGRVLASADLLENIYGGSMRVVIIPRQGEGHYDGTLSIEQTKMRGASAMASLLNAISVVGLVQQLDGEGIYFSTVEGQFLMRPNGVQLKDISAVGPSMGLTLDGWYDSANKTVDFEGVTTPIYLLNGVFERVLGPLFGRRKGEGLFSFTYRMKGPAKNPRVAVNPLSILTPDAFREVFRSDVPVPLSSDGTPAQAEVSASASNDPTISPAPVETDPWAAAKPLASDLR